MKFAIPLFLNFALIAQASSTHPECPTLLLKMHSKYYGEDTGDKPVVYFSSSEDRGPFRVSSKNGRLSFSQKVEPNSIRPDYKHADGTLGDGNYFFVVGPDQELYAAHETLTKLNTQSSTKMRHSSFFAGGDVADAGGFSIVNQRITKVTQNSGHYKPNLAAFLRTLSKLRQKGAPIDSATKFKIRVVGDSSDSAQTIWVDLDSLPELGSTLGHSEVEVFQGIIKRQVMSPSSKTSSILPLLRAYLTSGKRLDSFVVQHLPAAVELSLNHPGELEITVSETIGRKSFYLALAEGGPDGRAALRKWISRLIEIKSITKENAGFDAEDIQSIPDKVLDKGTKASLLSLLRTAG